MNLQVICDSHGYQILDSIHGRKTIWLSCGCILHQIKNGVFKQHYFPLECSAKRQSTNRKRARGANGGKVK